MSITGDHFMSYVNVRCIIFHTVHFRCTFHVRSITSVYFISWHIQMYMSRRFQLSISYHVNFRCTLHANFRCTFHVKSITDIQFMSCEFQVCISYHVNFWYTFHLNFTCIFHVMSISDVHFIIIICISCHANYRCAFHVMSMSISFHHVHLMNVFLFLPILFFLLPYTYYFSLQPLNF